MFIHSIIGGKSNMKKDYVTIINGVDLFEANIIQCAYLIFNVENVQPAIIKKVEQWQQQQINNCYWNNPLHC
jgi:hypothetical protein